MRRFTLPLIGGALWLFLAAPPVFADGGPHVLTINNGSAGISADSCAGCHRVHTSKSPTGFLLTDASPTITGYCRSCHGATGAGAATDVDTGVQYADAGSRLLTQGPTIGALRSGGFFLARIGSSNASRNLAAPGAETKNAFIPVVAPTPVTSAHLAVPGNGLTATNKVWGNGGINSSVYGPTLAKSMECTSCHNPHGNGNYRILDTLPLTSAGVPVAATPALVIGSLVSPSTRDTTTTPPSYIGSWTAVTGMAVKDSPYVAGRQKNYTVIAKAPAGTENYPAYPIPNPTPGAYLLYTDQLGAYAGAPLTGDYLKKFLTYNVDEEATPGTAISNFYDGPNGSPNQGGFSATGSRLTDFPENVPASATAGKNYEGFGYQMALWCTQCHTRYLGWNGSRTTTSTDNTYMFRHSTTKYRVCSTCHVAHGSNAVMNDPTAPLGGFSRNVPFPDSSVHSGDSRLLKIDNRGICLECHDPTGTATGYQGPAGGVTTAP